MYTMYVKSYFIYQASKRPVGVQYMFMIPRENQFRERSNINVSQQSCHGKRCIKENLYQK